MFRYPLDKREKKVWGTAKWLLRGWAGNDPARVERVADFEYGTTQTAPIDVTTFREAYVPRRWYGQFQLVRVHREGDGVRTEIVGVGPGRSGGFNSEAEASEAMLEDMETLGDEGLATVERYILVPRRRPKAERVLPMDVRPGQAWAVSEEIYWAIRQGGEAAVRKAIEELGGATLSKKQIKEAAAAGARGTEAGKIVRGEMKNAVLDATRRRKGREGWSRDFRTVIMDHARDVAYHVHQDRVMMHATDVLHDAGVTHGLRGNTDARDTDETKAFRSVVKAALGIPDELTQKLDMLDARHPFIRGARRRGRPWTWCLRRRCTGRSSPGSR